MSEWIQKHWEQTGRLLARKKLATEFVARMPKPSDFNPSPRWQDETGQLHGRPNFDHENYDFMLALERFVEQWKTTAKDRE